MEPPAPKTVTHALIAGLMAGVIALVVIEVIDLVISRFAHHQSKKIDTEVWNYYAVRDATGEFLAQLYAYTAGANGNGADTAIGGEPARADGESTRVDADTFFGLASDEQGGGA